jgi:hypothetical protein
MADDPQRSAARTFTLAGLFELMALVALTLGLITQLGAVGLVCAWGGVVMIVGEHYAVFWKLRPRGHNRILAGGLVCLLLVSLPLQAVMLALLESRESGWRSTMSEPDRPQAIEAARAREVGDEAWWLLGLQAAFVAYAILWRERLARRMQDEPF